MGRLIHPAAIQARQALASQNLRSAAIQIKGALEREPANPDLTCELAISYVYEGEESKAFELLPICSRGMRFEELVRLLATHYQSRISLDPFDHDATHRLSLMNSFQPTSQAQGTKLSACLIVKNEEKVLARCLQSLKGLADEVVIVDTGSTDRTREIAESFHAIIGDFPWTNDFAAARNHALSLATGNWILWIDADEELIPESFASIREAIVRPQFGGYDIEIVNFLEAGNDGDQFRHSPTRLFQKLPGVRFTGRIHEQINPSLRDLGLPWARLEGAMILHHGYRPETMAEKSKLTRTLSLLEREVQEDPANAFQWFNLANAYLVAKQYEEAANAAKFSVKLLTPKEGFAVNAYSILMQSLMALARNEEGLSVAEEATAKGVAGLQISFDFCNLLLANNDLDRAMIEARKMLEQPWVEGSSGDRGVFTHKRYIVFAQIALAKGLLGEAMEKIEVAVNAAPTYRPAHFVLGEILEKLGRTEESRAAYERSIDDPICTKAAVLGIHRTFLSESDFDGAANFARRLWEANPSATDLWLLWKRSWESKGDVRATLECYQEFSKVHRVTPDFLVEWGRCAVGCGEFSQALQCFAEAMRIEPTHANAYFNCADLLYRLGSFSEAINVYEAGLSLIPNHPEGWFMMGNALAKAERITDAMNAYRRALASEPDHHGASHNLALLCA